MEEEGESREPKKEQAVTRESLMESIRMQVQLEVAVVVAVFGALIMLAIQIIVLGGVDWDLIPTTTAIQTITNFIGTFLFMFGTIFALIILALLFVRR
ncbi:MAG: hypothetical protein V3W22_07555 [Thermoplasmata archaeon]